VKEGSGSFLKKRTKKLLVCQARADPTVSGRGQGRKSKSFLVLFFKKEPLPSLLRTAMLWRSGHNAACQSSSTHQGMAF
jgi:hypothetical protein